MREIDSNDLGGSTLESILDCDCKASQVAKNDAKRVLATKTRDYLRESDIFDRLGPKKYYERVTKEQHEIHVKNTIKLSKAK